MYKKLLFVTIVIFGLFLRLFQLGQYPISVSWDEAAIGYNAYSILKTGADEYGIKFPILFKSFSDYKLPGYVYLTALSEKFFGLNAFAVRFPSAILGALTIIAVYFLVKEILVERDLVKKESEFFDKYKKHLPFIAAFMMAVSPWHLQFSRGGFEANGQLLFLTLGFYFILRFLRKSWSLVWAALFLGISFYFYYTTRVLTPFMGLVFILLFFKNFLANKKQLVISAIIFTVVVLPLTPHFFRESNERVAQVSILTDQSTNITYSQAMARHPDSFLARIVYNRRFVFLNTFLENYFRNNSLEFYFINGDLYPRHDIIGMGLLYLWELPFFILGIYYLAILKTKKKWIVFTWWLIGGIPASLTTGSPHALRTLSSLPVYIIFTTIGIYFVFIVLRGKQALLGKIYLLCFPLLVLYYFISYIFFYYDFTTPVYAAEWGDGHRQMVNEVVKRQDNYDQILVTGRFFKPYIHFLFYEEYDPKKYHEEGGSDSGFYKYKFYPADWEKSGQDLESVNFANYQTDKKTLIVLPYGFAKNNLKTVGAVSGEFAPNIFILQEIIPHATDTK